MTGIAARRHPLALLALLTTAPSATLGRGKVAGTLWPESSEKSARNRLNTCLHHVRTAVGRHAVESVGDDLRLNAEVVTCDVRRFEAALEAGEPRTAVELYRGPFLDGFRLGGSPAFEHRVDLVRDRLRREYHRALEVLAREAEEGGEPEAAAGWWRERVDEDPYDSRVAARLMETLAASGNRAAALRVAEEHARLLREEFGTEPSAEVRALADRLEEQEVAPGRGRELPARAVAVLPFECTGGSAEAEPFGTGLHEDLLTELARVSALTVISRTSVAGYRGTAKSVREVARELGVGTVVQGGVQWSAGRVRLNVQLVDGRSGALRWGETYDRKLTAEDIFIIQSELARKIASTLRAELTPEERERIRQVPTDSLEAYHLYVQGRTHLQQRTREGIDRALDHFRRATERDLSYALAWAGLAEARAILEFYGYASASEAPDPRKAARRAVALSPDLGEAHAALGVVRAVRHEGRDAVEHLERAVELTPSSADAHTWLGWVHLLLGRPKRALRPAIRAAELDPLAPAVRVYLAEIRLANGEGRKALAEARRAREIQPAYGLTHFVEGLALHHLGRLEEARSVLEEALPRARPMNPSAAEVRALLAVTRAAAGDGSGAHEELLRIEESGDPFSTGLVHAALGNEDRAFEAFERVVEWGSFANEHLRYFFPTVLGPLREDRRYERLLRDVERAWKVEANAAEDDEAA